METKSIEIAQKIFWDDYENALSKQYNTAVRLKNGVPKDKIDAMVSEYALSHHQWIVNEKKMPVQFVGYEIEMMSYGFICW